MHLFILFVVNKIYNKCKIIKLKKLAKVKVS
jgi:hypothetical protein